MKMNNNIFEKQKTTVGEVLALLSSRERSEAQKAILGQSVYYYCSGIDSTPVSAFGCQPSVYVYVDTLVAIHKDFDRSMAILHERIATMGYTLAEQHDITAIPKIPSAKRAKLFRFVCGEGEFLLLYLRADGEDAFTHLYGSEVNYIQPICVCNYRNEAGGDTLRVLEKRVSYILGHAFGEKYYPVCQFDYLGDYGGEGQKVTLYRRAYYYLY